MHTPLKECVEKQIDCECRYTHECHVLKTHCSLEKVNKFGDGESEEWS
jgi:hypothetical protein